MIKLAFIITGLGRGGAEKMLIKLLSLMDKDKFKPAVFCLTNKIDLVPEIQKLGIPVFTYRLNNPIYITLDLIKFIRNIISFAPQIIQGWMYHGNIFAWVARYFTKAKLLFGMRVCLYDFNYESKTTQWAIKLGQWLSTKVDGTIYVSEVARLQHEAIGYNPKNAITIANGFDLQAFKPSLQLRQESREKLNLKAENIAIGYFARFHKMKGHSYLIQSFSSVVKTHPESRLILSGLNVDENNTELTQEISKFGLQNHIQLLGQLTRPELYLPALDLFVSPSLQEGFPNVVGEAMACGVPCVVTDVGDSALAVGDTGLVVPSKDSKALSEAIMQLLNQPSKLSTLGQKAKLRIEKEFSLPGIVKKYESVYEKFTEIP